MNYGLPKRCFLSKGCTGFCDPVDDRAFTTFCNGMRKFVRDTVRNSNQ